MNAPRSGTATGAAPAALQLRSSAGLYGADRMVLALNAGLRALGAPSRLLSIRNPLTARQELHEAAVAAGQDAALLPCRGRVDPRTIAALAAQIDAGGAGALHVHDYKSAFYAWLATRRRPQVRLVATLHGWVESSRALRVYTQLELALLRRFDALAIVAADQRERLLRAGVAPGRIHAVDNGIVPPAPRPPDPALRRELGLEGAGTTFAAVARLSPEKNLAQLLAAFAHVAARDDGVRLLFVGDGPERGALAQRASALGLEARVRFAGARGDMDRIYPLVDCLVLPSLSEGMPLVVLEAMACGIPVVASAVGEIPRLLAHAPTGRLVPPGDETALREAMAAMASRDATRDVQAAAYVRAHHSDAAMARRYLDLYRQLAEDGRERRSA